MISVFLYKNFGKDINSTKQPVSGSGAVGVPFQCYIYEPCSIINPVIKLEYSGTDLQTQGYTYAHIPTFGNRHYWITDMVYQEGFWYVHLSVDVLATFKTAIGASSQYILRSAYDQNDWIIDDIYAPVSGQLTDSSWAINPFAQTVSQGVFVLGIAGGTPTYGALQYVSMTISELYTFVTYLLGQSTYLGDLGDVTADMAKLILNPLQYIQSCIWFPVALSPLGEPLTSVKVGWWDVPCSARRVSMASGGTQIVNANIGSIPVHPQSYTIGLYLRKSPYSQYRLWVPPIGFVDISADMLCDMTYVTIQYTIDIVTGRSLIDVIAIPEDGADKLVYSTTAQLAVTVPLAQVTGTGSYITSGAQQLKEGSLLGGLSKLVTGGIGLKLGTTMSSGGILGEAGTTSVFQRDPELQLIYTEMAPNAPALLGKPLCDTRVISTLPGFIMCGHAHISIPSATKTELEMIETFMNEGFYYE